MCVCLLLSLYFWIKGFSVLLELCCACIACECGLSRVCVCVCVYSPLVLQGIGGVKYLDSASSFEGICTQDLCVSHCGCQVG